MSGKKGMKHKNKRKPMSEEQKRQISKTLKKRWKEKEYRENMCNAHKHPLPDKWKENIAWSRVGVKVSDKTRKKMSEVQKKLSLTREYDRSPRPKEVREKVSKGLKRFYQTPEGVKKKKQASVVASRLALEGKFISNTFLL